MALPNSGTITADMINVELRKSPNAPFSLNDPDARALAEKPSGTISYTDFLGKSSMSISIIRYRPWLRNTAPNRYELNENERGYIDLSVVGGTVYAEKIGGSSMGSYIRMVSPTQCQITGVGASRAGVETFFVRFTVVNGSNSMSIDSAYIDVIAFANGG